MSKDTYIEMLELKISNLKDRLFDIEKQNVTLKQQLKLQGNVNHENHSKAQHDRNLFEWNCKNMGYNKGDFIFIHYRKGKDKFSSHAFVHKESLDHISILVYDVKRESAHKYSISKKVILGIKLYDGDECSLISYDNLIKLWESHGKKGAKVQ